jgi:Tn3 transposase DDE domain
MVSNRREDHEISMLALNLLQKCMVYINTLMLQRVPARPRWSRRLTARDIRAMTPLIWEHVNPYGHSNWTWRPDHPSTDTIWPLVTRLLGLGQVARTTRRAMTGKRNFTSLPPLT